MRRLMKATAIAAALVALTVLVRATASYPGAVKSFTTKTDGPGQTIFAAHINDLQDEVVAIENGLINGLGHVLKPLSNATYDLGSSSLRWNNLFLAGNVTRTGTTDGQIPIGRTSDGQLVFATLTAGSGVTITNGGGSVTVATSSSLDKVTAEQDVTGTVTETSVYSFSVPGGTLGTTNGLRLTLTGYAAVNGAGDTLNIRVKFGGTTIAAGAMTLAANALGGTKLETIIVPNGATNQQRAVTKVSQASAGATTDGAYDTSPGLQFTASHSTLAVDSTSTQTLQVTVQWGSASGSNHYRRWLAMTEKL
jgi:hypothetical protein